MASMWLTGNLQINQDRNKTNREAGVEVRGRGGLD